MGKEMKDNIYNGFKRDLSKYHRKGYEMDFPSTETSYDEEKKENIVYIQLTFTKKGKRQPDI
jgi:hypothetical protein